MLKRATLIQLIVSIIIFGFLLTISTAGANSIISQNKEFNIIENKPKFYTELSKSINNIRVSSIIIGPNNKKIDILHNNGDIVTYKYNEPDKTLTLNDEIYFKNITNVTIKTHVNDNSIPEGVLAFYIISSDELFKNGKTYYLKIPDRF